MTGTASLQPLHSVLRLDADGLTTLAVSAQKSVRYFPWYAVIILHAILTHSSSSSRVARHGPALPDRSPILETSLRIPEVLYSIPDAALT